MTYTEHAFVFSCGDEELVGIIAGRECNRETGVLIVVGGPQYRVGSHRQFLLLARSLAADGYPVMRFDYGGMGDSSGSLRDFERVEDDIAAALDTFLAKCPSVKRVVLWGLCDAASASLLYWDATRDVRIGGLCLLNPWMRSAATLAKTHVKHYYGQRLMQPEFWSKLLRGQVGVGKAVGGFARSLLTAQRVGRQAGDGKALSFQGRMTRALRQFSGPMLLVLSGNDYTAKEFLEQAEALPELSAALQRPCLKRIDVAEADHTFSSALWRNEVASATLSWLREVETTACPALA